MMTGAAVAVTTGSWWWSVLLPIVLHFGEDMLPHLDPSLEHMSRRQWFFWASIDFFIGLILVLLVVGNKMNNIVMIAVLAGVLPDILSIIEYFFPTGIGHVYRRWHKMLQTENSTWLGVVTQVMVFGLAVGVILLSYW